MNNDWCNCSHHLEDHGPFPYWDNPELSTKCQGDKGACTCTSFSPVKVGALVAEVVLLKKLLREVQGCVGHYHGPLGSCTACAIDKAVQR